MNLLICSIGTRGYLVDHFREDMDEGDHIFGADCFAYAPALQLVDKAFVIPRASHKDYIPHLLRLCREHHVDCILSINDLELPVLAKHQSLFLDTGTKVIISSPEVVEICYDKYKTYRFLCSQGLGTPHTYLISEKNQLLQDIEEGNTALPIIFKPRRGSGSQGLSVARDMQTLYKLIAVEETLPEGECRRFVQEFVGGDQYSVHVFNDANLEPVAVIGMVNLLRHMEKETFHIRAFRDPALQELGLRLGTSLKHLGPISADVHKKSTGYVVLEINPRLSGCYSLTHFAGGNFTGKIIALAKGLPIPSNIDGFDDNVVMLKQYTVMKTSEPGVRAKIIDYRE
jgi:carbamoyl-phosphate synthase large subunit